MNQDKHERLRDILGPDAGMSVPEDFFEKRFSEINSQLPPFPKAPTPEKLSRWQMLRPYIYMAAMFAGIWLMMQVFHHAAGDMTLNLDNPPEHIAMAMQDSDINSDYFIIPESYSEEAEMVYEVSSQYNSIEDFAEDFGYEMEPEYASMKINE